MDKKETALNDTAARARMYRFLASVYLSPPTPRMVEELKKLGVIAGSDIEALHREYENLFVVPLGQYTTPYEAVYRDEREVAGKKVRGLLMGPSTVDAIQRYREAGAEMDRQIKELPDHIGVELAFMEYLCEREAEARQSGDDPLVRDILQREHSFIEDHLLSWIPSLVEKIHSKGKIAFYKELASLTEEVVRDHLQTRGGCAGYADPL